MDAVRWFTEWTAGRNFLRSSGQVAPLIVRR